MNSDWKYNILNIYIYAAYRHLNSLKETTRCFGPGTQLFPRVAAVDNYLNGLGIRKGTEVMVMHVGNHFSDKYFKDPN